MPSATFLTRDIPGGDAAARYAVYVPTTRETALLPVILALHGSGERGTDGMRQTTVGFGEIVRAHGDDFPAIVVFPQAAPDETWRDASALRALAALDAALTEFRGDPARVYLTGLSLGGNGAWHLALAEPARFAALVVVCGWLDTNDPMLRDDTDPAANPYLVAARRLRHLPTWLFHGAQDRVIPATASRQMADALEAVGAEPHYTEYPNLDHVSWTAAYNEPALLPWLLSQHRGADRGTPPS